MRVGDERKKFGEYFHYGAVQSLAKLRSDHGSMHQREVTNRNGSTSTMTTTTTTWPDAAPLAGEELIFSISCGNSHLHWATHLGQDQDYNPDMFWRCAPNMLSLHVACCLPSLVNLLRYISS